MLLPTPLLLCVVLSIPYCCVFLLVHPGLFSDFGCLVILYVQSALSKVQSNFLYSIEDDDYSLYPDEEVVKLDLLHNLKSIIDAKNADDQAYFEQTWKKIYRQKFYQRFTFNRSAIVKFFIQTLCTAANVVRPTPKQTVNKEFLSRVKEDIVQFVNRYSSVGAGKLTRCWFEHSFMLCDAFCNHCCCELFLVPPLLLCVVPCLPCCCVLFSTFQNVVCCFLHPLLLCDVHCIPRCCVLFLAFFAVVCCFLHFAMLCVAFCIPCCCVLFLASHGSKAVGC